MKETASPAICPHKAMKQNKPIQDLCKLHFISWEFSFVLKFKTEKVLAEVQKNRSNGRSLRSWYIKGTKESACSNLRVMQSTANQFRSVVSKC